MAQTRVFSFIFLLSCTKGDLFTTLTGEAGFVLGIPLQLDRNRFESPSLPDSENLTEQRQRRVTKLKIWLNDDDDDDDNEP